MGHSRLVCLFVLAVCLTQTNCYSFRKHISFAPLLKPKWSSLTPLNNNNGLVEVGTQSQFDYYGRKAVSALSLDNAHFQMAGLNSTLRNIYLYFGIDSIHGASIVHLPREDDRVELPTTTGQLPFKKPQQSSQDFESLGMKKSSTASISSGSLKSHTIFNKALKTIGTRTQSEWNIPHSDTDMRTTLSMGINDGLDLAVASSSQSRSDLNKKISKLDLSRRVDDDPYSNPHELTDEDFFGPPKKSNGLSRRSSITAKADIVDDRRGVRGEVETTNEKSASARNQLKASLSSLPASESSFPKTKQVVMERNSNFVERQYLMAKNEVGVIRSRNPDNYVPILARTLHEKTWKAKAKTWGIELNDKGNLLRDSMNDCSTTRREFSPECICMVAQNLRITFLSHLVVVVASQLIAENVIYGDDAMSLIGVSMGTDSCRSDVDMTISGKAAIVLQKALYKFFRNQYGSDPDKMFDTNFYVAEFQHNSVAYPSIPPPCTEMYSNGGVNTIYLAGVHDSEVVDFMNLNQHITAFRALKYYAQLPPANFDPFNHDDFSGFFVPADELHKTEPVERNFYTRIAANIDSLPIKCERASDCEFTETQTRRIAREKLKEEYDLQHYVNLYVSMAVREIEFDDEVYRTLALQCAETNVNCQDFPEVHKLGIYSATATDLYDIITKGTSVLAGATKPPAISAYECKTFIATTAKIAILAPESYWSRNTFAHSVTCRQGSYNVLLYPNELFDSVVENFGHLIKEIKSKDLTVMSKAIGLAKYTWRMYDAGNLLYQNFIKPLLDTQLKPFSDIAKIGEDWAEDTQVYLRLNQDRNKDQEFWKPMMDKVADRFEGARAFGIHHVTALAKIVNRFIAWMYLIRAYTSDFKKLVATSILCPSYSPKIRT